MRDSQHHRLHWLHTFCDIMFRLGVCQKRDYKSYVPKENNQKSEVLNTMQYKKWLAGIPWYYLTHLDIAGGICHGPEKRLANTNTAMGSIQLFCKVFLKYNRSYLFMYCLQLILYYNGRVQLLLGPHDPHSLHHLLSGLSQKIICQNVG